MANLPEVSTFDNVYQIEITDLVQGGASGVTNTPMKNLTNRTKWLKDRADALEALIGSQLIKDTAEVNLSSGVAVDLDGADVGTLYLYNVSANTVVNLCAASAAPKKGFIIQVKSANATNIILTRAGSDTIYYENQVRNSFPVFGGESLMLVSDGVSKWFVMADTRDQSPAGEVIAFAASTAPGGFLKANGAAISRTTYARLFATIGTTFGVGDGSTTFNLPDLRGEFIRGWDDGRSVDTGRVFGSAQAATALNEHVSTDGTNLTTGVVDSDGFTTYSIPGRLTTSTGSSLSYKRWLFKPRNVAMLYCIKY